MTHFFTIRLLSVKIYIYIKYTYRCNVHLFICRRSISIGKLNIPLNSRVIMSDSAIMITANSSRRISHRASCSVEGKKRKRKERRDKKREPLRLAVVLRGADAPFARAALPVQLVARRLSLRGRKGPGSPRKQVIDTSRLRA